MFTLLPFIDILSVSKNMIGKSTSSPMALSKSESESRPNITHRELNGTNTINLNPKALAECKREIRALANRKESYNFQRVYKLLDNAFFGGQISGIARIIQYKSQISTMADSGSLLRLDSRGGTVICLPPQDNRSVQDIITILIREMACINFWKVNTCSCEQCRYTKGALKICDFVAYISELNAFLNFQLTGFQSQWKIDSDEFSILKDIVKDLQDAKRAQQEFAFTFKIPKPAPEVTLVVEEPLDNEEPAPKVSSPVEDFVDEQEPAPEVSSRVEELSEKEDSAPEVSSPVEEFVDEQDPAPEVSSRVEELFEKQEPAREVSSPVEDFVDEQDPAPEVSSRSKSLSTSKIPLLKSLPRSKSF